MRPTGRAQECSSFPKQCAPLCLLGMREVVMAGSHTTGAWVRRAAWVQRKAQRVHCLHLVWGEKAEGINRKL